LNNPEVNKKKLEEVKGSIEHLERLKERQLIIQAEEKDLEIT
jgi:hypothetical protein